MTRAARAVRALLEGRDDAGFAAARAFDQEGRSQDALARARGAGHQQRVAARQAAAHHLVQARHAHLQSGAGAAPRIAAACGIGHPRRREHLQTGGADAKRVQARQRRLPAHLHDLHLAHDRVALHALAQPDQAVGHGEHRIGIVLGEVLADQESRGLPARHQHAELLHELLQADEGLAAAPAPGPRSGTSRRRPAAGSWASTSATMRSSTLSQVAGRGFVRQIDEADRRR